MRLILEHHTRTDRELTLVPRLTAVSRSALPRSLRDKKQCFRGASCLPFQQRPGTSCHEYGGSKLLRNTYAHLANYLHIKSHLKDRKLDIEVWWKHFFFFGNGYLQDKDYNGVNVTRMCLYRDLRVRGLWGFAYTRFACCITSRI